MPSLELLRSGTNGVTAAPELETSGIVKTLSRKLPILTARPAPKIQFHMVFLPSSTPHMTMPRATQVMMTTFRDSLKVFVKGSANAGTLTDQGFR